MERQALEKEAEDYIIKEKEQKTSSKFKGQQKIAENDYIIRRIDVSNLIGLVDR